MAAYQYMKDQLYRKLRAGERVERTDIMWDQAFFDWITGKNFEGCASSENSAWMRPIHHEPTLHATQSPAVEPFDIEVQPDAPTPTMSIREHYAGLAMQSLIQSPIWSFDGSPISKSDSVCSLSVTFADALIAALNKKD